ncbi:uncharacterized protein LY89DRAFT_785050 [Mollisia scopiformis]|uniref:Zn(2)-C6 fungal-type domain-containing protein n=1 Tax=Mollisia scopiformis TaxID=149040 RepID=A0A194WZE9_MOLSC|nr:uncharacterized protein LY89DRAFT_785050 [Mollisia scopiformis]KUJ13323.1 hypothetical protein LY89DRAFT_785050 [Mollisia scopiformis]
MTEMTNYTGVFRAVPNLNDGRRLSKRNRQPVSCSTCRLKKLKCDRQKPCGSCSRGGHRATCDYVTRGESRHKDKETSGSEANARLRRLEEMVQGLIQESGLAKQSTYASPRVSAGEHLRQGTEVSYIGATHWEAILESIHDVQDYFESDSDSSFVATRTDRLSDVIVLGQLQPLSLNDVLAALPSHSTVNKLLALYFNATFIVVPFIHTAKFQRECEAFWENPPSKSFFWLSILFSTLCLGSIVSTATGKEVDSKEVDCSPSAFFIKAGQCLSTGNYLKALPNSVEALVLYAHCKFIYDRDSDPSVWALYGLATRLAQRMGYHRDPYQLSARVSAFEAEMRRRVWYFIDSFDALFSFQLGLPAITHGSECDTIVPSNLPDSDFDEGTEVLPQPRPESEATRILSFRVKIQLMRLLRHVSKLALATEQPEYENIMQVDRELQRWHEDVPACLKNRPIASSSFMDHTHIIVFRCTLQILYLKAVCHLHRTYITYQKENKKFDASRKRCVDAALEILDLQAEVHRESQPFRRLYEDRWIVTSITLHNHLLAAMVICLTLCESATHIPSEYTRMTNAVKTSYDIFAERKHMSKDAAHATTVLAAILRKISGHGSSSKAMDGMQMTPLLPVNEIEEYVQVAEDHHLELDPFDNVLNNTENFDWNFIDQYLLDGSKEVQYDI